MNGYATFLLWPVLAHIALIFVLYAWLTVERMGAVSRGEVEYSCFVTNRDEPAQAARIRRNLSNQFELPLLFYAIVVLLIALGRVTPTDVAAAWLFVVGRVIHTCVQTLTDNVQLRGIVFTINFLAVAILAGHVALLALQGIPR